MIVLIKIAELCFSYTITEFPVYKSNRAIILFEDRPDNAKKAGKNL